jgi:chromosome segregation ATPase
LNISLSDVVVSNKKQELDNMIDQFNIQIDNPVCFLNQETSKHFLNTSNKSDKYKLFLKASQLDSMRKLNEQVVNERALSLKMIADKESYLPRMEQELFQAEDRYKKCQSVDKLKQKLSLMYSEFNWSCVNAKEREIEALEKEKRVATRSKEKLAKKIDESEESLTNVNVDYEQVKKSIDELMGQVSGCKQKESKSTSRFKAAQTAFRSAQGELTKLKNLTDKKRKDRNELQKKLNEDKQSARVDYESEKAQHEAKLSDVRNKLKEMNANIADKSKESQRLTSNVEAKRGQARDKGYEMKNTESLMRNAEGDISNLENARRDQIYRFGDFMAGLVSDVKAHFEAGKFRQMPKGPLGMYIKPKSDEWSLAIEQCIGVFLKSFICGSHEDERVLQQLISRHVKQARFKPRIIVCNFNEPLYDADRFVSVKLFFRN